MNRLSGVHVALATAMNEDCSLNLDATEALAEDLIARGIHGIVVNGSTGEFASMSFQERQQVAEAVIKLAGGRVPVTVQVGSMCTTEAVAHARHAADQGASAALVVCPYYEALDEREVQAYFEAVAHVGLPVMIYNNPAATGWSMAPELIAKLCEIEHVDYIKDTTTEPGRLFRIRELCGDRLQILSGQDSLAILGFLAGSEATVWGSPNATPDACLRLWDLTVTAPDLTAARDLWGSLYPVMRFFEENGYVQSVKTATNLRGINVGPPRHPALELDPEKRRVLAALLDNLAAAMPSSAAV